MDISFKIEDLVIEECRDIATLIKRIDEMYPTRRPKLFDETHVFDEDQSVKWNREEVKRWNETSEKTWKNNVESNQRAKQLLDHSINKYIYEELEHKWSWKQCQVFYNHAYAEFEWSLFEGKLDTLIEMIHATLSVVD